MISLRTQAETETNASLDGVIAALDGPALSPELALIPLRVYGDAVRLGLEAPHRLRTWAAAASAALLDDVLRASDALLREVGALAPKDSEDPTLATKLRERDHVESVLTAVRRVWLPRPLAQLEAYPLLMKRLGAWDEAARARVSRSTATHLLGVRAGLGATWLERYLDDEAASPGDDGDLRAALQGTRPPLAVVARYVESGAMRAFVEDAAATDDEFADDLADTIEGLRAVDQAGFTARSWLKRREKAAGPSAFTFGAPRLAHAAAGGEAAAAPLVHRLGTLFAGVDAVAEIRVSEREIVFEVDFERGAIARIELGTAHAIPAAEDETCRLVVARSQASVRVSVRASSGQEVSEDFSFLSDAP